MFEFEKSVAYGNPVVEKSLKFAIRVVKLYKYIIKKDRYPFAVYNQLLNCKFLIVNYTLLIVRRRNG